MRELRAGPLSLLLDGRDVRCVSWGRVELVRRLGVAVRDSSWRTVPASSGHAEVLTGEDGGGGFAVRVAARHRSAELDVSWEGLIEAGADGRLLYSISWWPERDIAFNRIGLVGLLPPQTVCGRACVTRGPDGEHRSVLPVDIVAQPFHDGRFHAMLPPFSSCSVAVDGGAATCSFEGELFEIEDQRNWADDSFKIYGTPLATPLPQRAGAGRRTEQRVGLAFAPGGEGAAVSASAARGEAARRVGAVGLLLSGEAGPVPAAVVAQLRAIGPAYLRHDAHPARAGWRADLAAAAELCADVGCALELAVHAEDPDAVGAVVVAAAAPLARVLVFGTARDPADPSCCTPAALVAAARQATAAPVPVAAGTDLSYADLNRWRSALPGADEVTYGVSPQVHERDDLTVLENLRGIEATVRSAVGAFAPRSVGLGRLVLREGEPDERLGTPWGAAWGLAAVLAALRAGASSVTAFATHGPSGVIGADGAPTPLADALATVTPLRGAPLRDLDDIPTSPLVELGLRRPASAPPSGRAPR